MKLLDSAPRIYRSIPGAQILKLVKKYYQDLPEVRQHALAMHIYAVESNKFAGAYTIVEYNCVKYVDRVDLRKDQVDTIRSKTLDKYIPFVIIS